MFAGSLVALIAAIGKEAEGMARSLRRALTDMTYRPEAHYMRGPGPKSRLSRPAG